MTVTEKAARKLEEDLVRRILDAGLGFRVSRDGQEHIIIRLDRRGQMDRVIDLGGIQVLADPSIADVLGDYELDYVDGPNGGFLLNDVEQARPRGGSTALAGIEVSNSLDAGNERG